MREYEDFPLSYQWWREEYYAYYIESALNCIFEYDFLLKKLSLITPIPSDIPYQTCAKAENYIYCFSEKSPIILAYDLSGNSWEHIDSRLPGKERLFGGYPWKYRNNIYIIVDITHQLFIFDTLTRKGSTFDMFPNNVKSNIWMDIFVYGDFVYGIIPEYSKISVVDYITGKQTLYEIPITDDDIYTIAFDGTHFWMSGSQKIIYRWDMKKNEIVGLDNFPSEFGYYVFNNKNYERKFYDLNPVHEGTFYTSVLLNNHLWFMPQRANQILAVDIDTLEIEKIYQENEDSISMANHDWGFATELAYVYNDRYIGLYTLKNNCFIEIDTLDKSYTVQKIKDVDLIKNKGVKLKWLSDKHWYHRLLYWDKIKKCENIQTEIIKNDDSMGRKILNVVLDSL